MARLPQARWPAGAPSAPGRLATALPHGGDTGAAAPRSTRGPPLAYRAQSRREACRVDGAGARQCGPPGLSRRRMTPRLQRMSTRPDGRKSGRHRRGSGVDQEPGGMPHGLLCRPWDRGGEGRPPGCERCSTSGVMRMTARVAERGPPLLECLAWRPTAPQRADASGADGLTPGSPRRAIGVQHGRQPRAEPGAVMDHAASGRPERRARSGLGMLGPPGLAPVPRVDEPCARLGEQAARDVARVIGCIGERPQTSSGTSAERRGPRAGSRPTAIGRPPTRRRQAVAQAASAAGIGGQRRDAGVPGATATRQLAGGVSDPSMATKAANGAIYRPPVGEIKPRMVGTQARGSAATS